MSDILIRGMEMAKNCKLCKLFVRPFCSYLDDIVSIPKYTDPIVGKRHEYCPLVEVPPHGDLIDRNNLLEKACYDYNEATHDYNHFRIVFEDDIIDAPVIIEGNMNGNKVMK